MSLLQLEDKLVAKVACHLEYSDICCFKESSRKNYDVVKNFKLDNIKLVSLSLSMSNNTIVVCKANTSAAQKRYKFRKLNNFEEPITMLMNIFDQISHVDYLKFKDLRITNDVVNALNENKDKINNLSFSGGSVNLSKSGFIAFCRTFKQTKFIEVEFNDELWCDEVLSEVIPYTVIDRDETFTEVKKSAKYITDRTLMSLVGEKGLQTTFNIRNVGNSFTIQGIMDLLEKVYSLEIEHLEWNLGLLDKSQAADATKYFDEDNGEFGLYDIQMFERASRTIYKLTPHRTKSLLQDADDSLCGWYDDTSIIYFAVAQS